MSLEKLFDGDVRFKTLLEALEKTLYERGEGLPIPAIIGVLELLKKQVMESCDE